MKSPRKTTQQSPKLTGRPIRATKPPSRAALNALLSETISFLLAAGLPRRSLASKLRKESRRLGAGARLRRPSATKPVMWGHEHLGEIAGVVHDWHRQAAYTSRRSGEPRALLAAELRGLIGRRLPSERIASTLRWMISNGIIRHRKDRRFTLSMGRQVVLKGRTMPTERAAALVPQYLRISLRNADTVNPHARDIDRDARVFFLPEKWLGLWRVVARERTEAFLEGVDNWLEDHSRPDGSGRVREVALHCYGFTGEPRLLKLSGTTNGGRVVRTQ